MCASVSTVEASVSGCELSKVNLEGKCNEKTANRNVRGQAGHEQEMRRNDANCMSLNPRRSPLPPPPSSALSDAKIFKIQNVNGEDTISRPRDELVKAGTQQAARVSSSSEAEAWAHQSGPDTRSAANPGRRKDKTRSRPGEESVGVCGCKVRTKIAPPLNQEKRLDSSTIISSSY